MHECMYTEYMKKKKKKKQYLLQYIFLYIAHLLLKYN